MKYMSLTIPAYIYLFHKNFIVTSTFSLVGIESVKLVPKAYLSNNFSVFFEYFWDKKRIVKSLQTKV